MDIPRGISWNPWHGCTKISAGCKYCYVYRQDEQYGSSALSHICQKNQSFRLPIQHTRDGHYKIPPGQLIYTCFTSDFLLADADPWRAECWEMIRERRDCQFVFFTKRIDRLAAQLPPDWGDGYDHVAIGCTVENQDRADYRLPIFRALPIKHRLIIMAPLLERVDISAYLDDSIEEVSVGGESGTRARPCDYAWVLDIRRQCVTHNMPFYFHQTGAHFIKNGKYFTVPRRAQRAQARKAQINFEPTAETAPEYDLTGGTDD